MERPPHGGDGSRCTGQDPPGDSLFCSRPDGAPGHLTDLGCPDCRSVLRVHAEGDAGLLVFTCRVGHTFSGESLLPAKEDQLETALWTSVECFEELALLHRGLGERAAAHGLEEGAAACFERAERALRLSVEIRDVIAQDGPAVPRGGPHGGAGT